MASGQLHEPRLHLRRCTCPRRCVHWLGGAHQCDHQGLDGHRIGVAVDY